MVKIGWGPNAIIELSAARRPRADVADPAGDPRPDPGRAPGQEGPGPQPAARHRRRHRLRQAARSRSTPRSSTRASSCSCSPATWRCASAGARRRSSRSRPAASIPAFQPPPGFPTLRRLAISLANSDNPRLRLETYMALTSNTIQFGAGLDVYVKVDTFARHASRSPANLTFDALIQFQPFELIAELRRVDRHRAQPRSRSCMPRCTRPSAGRRPGTRSATPSSTSSASTGSTFEATAGDAGEATGRARSTASGRPRQRSPRRSPRADAWAALPPAEADRVVSVARSGARRRRRRPPARRAQRAPARAAARQERSTASATAVVHADDASRSTGFSVGGRDGSAPAEDALRRLRARASSRRSPTTSGWRGPAFESMRSGGRGCAVAAFRSRRRPARASSAASPATRSRSSTSSRRRSSAAHRRRRGRRPPSRAHDARGARRTAARPRAAETRAERRRRVPRARRSPSASSAERYVVADADTLTPVAGAPAESCGRGARPARRRGADAAPAAGRAGAGGGVAHGVHLPPLAAHRDGGRRSATQPQTAARRAAREAQPSASRSRRAGIAQPRSATVDLDVLGPGDVTGIDPRQVIRAFPVPGHARLRARLLRPRRVRSPGPAVAVHALRAEADGTPAPVDLPRRRRAGRARDARARPAAAAARRSTRRRGRELPDPRRGHRVGARADHRRRRTAGSRRSPRTSPSGSSRGSSARACSTPNTRVPGLRRADLRGRARSAGLGRPMPATVPAATRGPATDPKVELPVYHSLGVHAPAAPATFASLVLRLEPRADLPGVGTRDLDVTDARVRPRRSRSAADDRRPRRRAARRRARGGRPVDADARRATSSRRSTSPTPSRPPIYGRWHAAVDGRQRSGGARSAGSTALNLDPRHRVAAGLGTQVVQERQEDLMAAVWEQLGEILRANQLLRQAQLAVAASERVVARHLAPLPDAALLAVAGPALARIRVGTGHDACAARSPTSCLPVLALSGAFRRIVARARAARPAARAAAAGPAFPDVAPPPTLDAALARRPARRRRCQSARAGCPHGAVAAADAGARRRARRPPAAAQATTGAEPEPARELAPTFATLASRAAAPACTPLDVGARRGRRCAPRIEPDVAVAGRARAQITVPADRARPPVAPPRPDHGRAGDPDADDRPAPGARPGLAAARDLGDAARTRVAIVEPNAAFIEAYMVGLNHEMGRELLWRGFPTDQRGTVFSRFWDRRGSVSTTNAPVPERDMPADPRSGARQQAELGAHLEHGAARTSSCCCVRGELLQRYPRATHLPRSAAGGSAPTGGR